MILAEDLAIMDWNSQKKWERNEGRKEGVEEGKIEGIKDTNALYAWLFSIDRADDVKRATEDDNYLKSLFDEFEAVKRTDSQTADNR